jgi:hypothetical protein
MTTYYRVDLANGIQVEEKEPVKVDGKKGKRAYYSDSPELGVSVFKDFRLAKAKFRELCNAEVARLKAMQRALGPKLTRRDVLQESA